MLALLLDTDLSSTQRDYAQTAQACGKALIALINEVLDRAKIEAGKLELEAVPFDLRSILDDVLSLFSEKSRNKGIEVSPSEFEIKKKKGETLSCIYCCRLKCLGMKFAQVEVFNMVLAVYKN